MFFILGTIILLLGTAIVIASDRYPSYKPTLQSWGGGLLVGGIALIGLSFPMI